MVPRASLGRICIPFLVKDNYFPKSQGTQWVQLHLGKERKLPHITNVYQITYFGTIQELRHQRGGWVGSENGNF